MSIKISGILPGPTGEPAAHIGITLRAVKTSLTVVATLESNSVTGVDGSYSLNVEPGQYDVLLWVDGINARNVGRITVYSDSLPGTLNNFLTALREEDSTPEIIRQLEQLRADALQAALEAKQSKAEATHQADIATVAAGNAAQETADLITATVKGDADRAEAAREGAETAQSAVNALTDEVVHYHTEVGQLALASEGSAAAAAQSSNSAAQSASESESSKNAAAQSEQEALASAESAGNSATAAAGDKAAANSFRNEAEQFAAQAKASAESIDVSALEAQINEKVSQTAFDEAIAGKASNEALTEGLADKMDIAGGVFEGPVQLNGNAIEPFEPVTLQQFNVLNNDAFKASQVINTPWINFTLLAGWLVGYRTVYRKVLGSLELDIHIYGGTITDGTIFAVLPVGFRPAVSIHLVPFAVGGLGNGVPPRIIIDVAGQMSVANMTSNSSVHLTCILPLQ
ncbi:prophage tail fiber N-terminal domain-containing protein [Yersinia alsatica]|uniref:prophage tail fiber N-terminal domain-containing protein n=1 Tax=Yersinia alsatica TaxID=2890317 RepID=UPI00119D584F|nr:prophage tail fiber N-terminal domain-containing protein [Yersinia alsatica]